MEDPHCGAQLRNWVGRDSFILSLVLMAEAEVEEFFPLILSCLQLYFKVTLACDDDAHKVIFNI